MVVAEADEIRGPERAEIPDVAPNADVVAEEKHRAAAKVPRGFAVVEVQHVTESVDLGTHDAKARQGVRAKANNFLTAYRNAQQQVAGRGEHAAAADIGLAIEVGAVCDVRLHPENSCAHESEADTPVETLRVDRIRDRLARIAAEVHAQKRNDHAVGTRCRWGQNPEQ